MLRRLILLLSLVTTLLAPAGAAAELPQPPGGYAWKQVPEIKGVFLIPDGWHYFQKREGKTFALFITKESIAEAGEFETGVSIAAILDTPSAPAQVKGIVESIARDYGSQVSPLAQEPFVRLTTYFDSMKGPDKKLIRTVTIGVVNVRTSTSYLVSFECPASEWQDQWPVGEVLLNTLGFESEL